MKLYTVSPEGSWVYITHEPDSSVKGRIISHATGYKSSYNQVVVDSSRRDAYFLPLSFFRNHEDDIFPRNIWARGEPIPSPDQKKKKKEEPKDSGGSKSSSYFPPLYPEAESDYSILYLREGAPFEVVKAAYRALMKIYHPDVPGGSEEKSKKVNSAFESLERKLKK